MIHVVDLDDIIIVVHQHQSNARSVKTLKPLIDGVADELRTANLVFARLVHQLLEALNFALTKICIDADKQALSRQEVAFQRRQTELRRPSII